MFLFTRTSRLNYLIAHFSKPYVALVDGIVMGGGAGLSMHGDFRVATERTLFAMPECGIGLFPDVGAAFFLQARAPPPAGRALALWLGVTGARLSGAELKQAGLATHCVHSSQLPQLEEQIKGLGAKASDRSVLNALLCDAEAAAPCGAASALADKLPVLERCFSQGSLLDVKKALEREAAGGSAFAADVLSDMRKKSPLSMAVAFELFKRAQGAPLGAVLQLDYLLAQHFSHDRCGRTHRRLSLHFLPAFRAQNITAHATSCARAGAPWLLCASSLS